jgi:hypothetical protein
MIVRHGWLIKMQKVSSQSQCVIEGNHRATVGETGEEAIAGDPINSPGNLQPRTRWWRLNP